ncbi:hypothetical protein Fmac_029624 [Flemingia macrophylla]|uniref:EF-hand domain-containing protein n=1 Tax=Flemingia macrophylla TaxID=520843 RepID=A0ABD1LAU0_9FABA
MGSSKFKRQISPPLLSMLDREPLMMDQGELARVFQMFDRNGDGRITRKELSESLKNLGISISEAELIQMIEKIDVNGDGYVDMDEFGELYQTIMDEKEEDEEEDMREAFNVFDQNGDGFISGEELSEVLSSLGLKHGKSVQDCQTMIKKVDVDGDGMVNYAEFKQMMKAGAFAASFGPVLEKMGQFKCLQSMILFFRSKSKILTRKCPTFLNNA